MDNPSVKNRINVPRQKKGEVLPRILRQQLWLERRNYKRALRRKQKRKATRKRNLREHYLRNERPKSNAELLLIRLRREFSAESNVGYERKTRSHIVSMPKNFSFISDAEGAMKCIKSLLSIPARSEAIPRAKRIYIDQRNCEKIGIAATAVFDVCAMLIKDEQKARGRKGYSFAGAFPRKSNVANQVKVMGITKHLEVAEAQAPKEFEDAIVHLPLQRGRRRADDWKGKNDQEIVSTRLAVYLNNCFETASNFALTEDAMAQIVKWAGEVITNAEEHSGVSDWYAMACMLPSQALGDPNAVIGECELVIFGFGKSIYETLSAKTTAPRIRTQIEHLVEEHTKSGFFSHSKYRPEDLWTLYALQEGVSSLSTELNSDRGTGTVRLIEAFQTLGQTIDEDKKPKMLLLSGATRIDFNGRYRMQRQQVDGGDRNILAFNASNSLRERPDPDCVGSISGFFPGTLLSFKFYVDQRFLETLPQPGK
jgi:hypothetical protein